MTPSKFDFRAYSLQDSRLYIHIESLCIFMQLQQEILKPALAEDHPKCICGLGPCCPVGGTCSQKLVVYSARVTPSNGGKVETYTGLTCRHFTARWKKHLKSQIFDHEFLEPLLSSVSQIGY